MTTADEIIAACQAQWPAHQNDCSGFARAVAEQLNVPLTGMADDIVGQIAVAPWSPLADGPAAAEAAGQGRFVIAGLKGGDQQVPSAHGHVVVVVAGQPAEGRYPVAYWGRLGGGGRQNTPINYAWTAADRDRVIYGAFDSA
jgi:hypothetical protein